MKIFKLILFIISLILFTIGCIMIFNIDIPFSLITSIKEKGNYQLVACQFIIIGLLLIMIILLLRKRKKEVIPNNESSIPFKNTTVELPKTRNSHHYKTNPFWMIILIIILISGLFYGACLIFSSNEVSELSEKITTLLWPNRGIILVVYLCLGFISYIYILRYDDFDKLISQHYDSDKTRRKVFVKHFTAVTGSFPLIYQRSDEKVINRRLFMTRLIIFIKSITSLFSLLLVVPNLIHFFISSSIKLSSNVYYLSIILLLLVNIDLFFYVFHSSINLFSFKGYKTNDVLYNHDEDNEKKTNFMIVLLLGFLLLIVYSIFFFIPYVKLWCRIKETKRFMKAYKQNDLLIKIDEFY